MDLNLKGQVAIVTGSTSGIGHAMAGALAAEGVNVVLNGLGDPATIEQVRADVRSAMDDIRVIVGGMSGEHIPASRMLADLRGEAATRLEDAGLSLEWPIAETEGPDRNLDFWIYKNVRSAHREVVSNVLRHARASHVKASAFIEDETLRLSVQDNGVGLAPKAPGDREGNGMRNTRRRLEQLGGTLTITSAEPGLRVEIAVPLTARG